MLIEKMNHVAVRQFLNLIIIFYYQYYSLILIYSVLPNMDICVIYSNFKQQSYLIRSSK